MLKVKNLIALRGAQEKGKSPTIELVLDKFMNIICPKNTDLGDKFIVVITIDGMVVVFICGGDTLADIKRYFKNVSKTYENIDLVLCACHPKKNSEDYLKSINKNVIFIDKTICEGSKKEQSIINQKDADEIYQKIKKILKIK